MTRAGLVLLFAVGCQAVPTAPLQREPAATRRWMMVERAYEDVDPMIRDAGDAEVAVGQTTLVFERVECSHRLILPGDVPERQQVGGSVEVGISIDCDPGDVHQVDVVPTRLGIRIIGFRGAMSVSPDLSWFQVQGSARVAVRFTADSAGFGGLKAILSDK